WWSTSTVMCARFFAARIRGRFEILRSVAASKPRILAQRAGATIARVRRRAFTPGRSLALVLLGLGAAAAFLMAPDTIEAPARMIVRALPLPDKWNALEVANARFWREVRIARGDTIGSLLARASIDDRAATAYLLSSPAARPLYQLKPGRAVHVATDHDGR